MSTIITKGTPRAVFPGWDDESARQLPITLEQIPQHLPLFYMQTERGPEAPQLVSGDEFLRMYGSESVNERGKFYSHQTLGARIAMSNANQVMVKRVYDAAAVSATMCLAIEIVDKDFDHYLRNPDGSVQVDAAGVKQLDVGNTFTGKNVAWRIITVTEDALNGQAIVTPGTLAGNGGASSTLYPIMAFQAAGKGAYGNNLGVRLSAPHAKSAAPGDLFAMADQEAFIYRLSFTERTKPTASPKVEQTLAGEQFVDFSFKQGVYNTRTEQAYDPSRVLEAYRSLQPDAGTIPVFGPMKDMYIYHDNVDTVLGLLHTADTAAGGTVTEPELINFFTGIDMNGNDHYGFRYDAADVGMNTISTHHLIGGVDGTVDEATLDTLVQNEVLNNWENPAYPLVDQLRYPFSCLYDTGFSLDTKKAMLTTLGLRPDHTVTCCTQDLSQPDNNMTAEIASGTAIRAAARLIPESVIYGTSACRAFIYRSMGELINSNYRRRVPLVMEIIHKRSRYMGAGDGRMKTVYRYDEAPRNRVNTLRNLTNTWAPLNTRDQQWELGINYIQAADRSADFFPAYQSVYDDDTSVLNSEINVLIATDITKMCSLTWSLLTGQSGLTQEQFIERSNQIFTDLVANRYDDRVTIVPNTRFTAADEARGYSWTMDVAVYMNNMRTVGTFNITVYRSTDLA